MPKKKSDTEKKPKGKKAAKSPKSPAADVASVLPAGLPVLVSTTPEAKPQPDAKAKAKTKPKAAPKKKPARRPAISNDDIALRAYFIAERRQKMGWPGNETSDWVEAERQLLSEVTKGR